MVVRKPFTLSMRECQQVLDAAEKTGAKILAGGQDGSPQSAIGTRRVKWPTLI